MWPSVIGAGANLLGGFMNADATAEQNQTNLNWTNMWNNRNMRFAERQQRDVMSANRIKEKIGYARDDNKIRRIAADARLAGISPLAALGSPAAGSMAAPIAASPGGQPGMISPTVAGIPSMGDSVATAVNQIGDAMANQETNALSLENQKLQNKMLIEQMKNMEAERAAMLVNARSRSLLAGARRAASDGATPYGQHGNKLDTAGNPDTYAQSSGKYGMLISELAGIGNFLEQLPAYIGARPLKVNKKAIGWKTLEQVNDILTNSNQPASINIPYGGM